VLFVCPLDTLSRQVVFAGAMDDASGFASVLNRQTFKQNTRPARNDRCSRIFTGEEKGCWVQSICRPRRWPENEIVARLMLDMFHCRCSALRNFIVKGRWNPLVEVRATVWAAHPISRRNRPRT